MLFWNLFFWTKWVLVKRPFLSISGTYAKSKVIAACMPPPPVRSACRRMQIKSIFCLKACNAILWLSGRFSCLTGVFYVWHPVPDSAETEPSSRSYIFICHPAFRFHCFILFWPFYLYMAGEFPCNVAVSACSCTLTAPPNSRNRNYLSFSKVG